MAIFTPQPLYSQGKSPWYTLGRRLGGPQSRSGRGGEEKLGTWSKKVWTGCIWLRIGTSGGLL
jgi:hypothetical protein